MSQQIQLDGIHDRYRISLHIQTPKYFSYGGDYGQNFGQLKTEVSDNFHFQVGGGWGLSGLKFQIGAS